MSENNTNTTTAENIEQEQPETQTTDQNTQQPSENTEGRKTDGERMYSQADVDRMIAQRVSREQRSFEARLKAAQNEARDQGRSEAEKLAQMTEQQRVEHERQEAEKAAREREDALAKREQEITNRELHAQAVEALREKGLSVKLADILVYHDADSVNASIQAVEKVMKEAIQEGVDARLRASGVRLPAPGTKPDYSQMSDAEYYNSVLPKK